MDRCILGTVIAMLYCAPAQPADPACEGRWVDPVSDVCWTCLFPLSVGSTPVSPGRLPDTENPASPLQLCPAPPPVFERPGVAIGYWEPFAMTDVTRAPGCMVNMGGLSLPVSHAGTGTGTKTANEHPGTFYHVHWYKYPLIAWLNIMTSALCMQGGEYDILYLSELDPTWQNDTLALFIHPEAMLFARPEAQMACAADAVASAISTPLDALFWCAGAHGSLYPFTGNIVNESSGLNSAALIAERLNFKLHREGLILETAPYNTAVCHEYPSALLPKSRYRYQKVNTLPDVTSCHPLGRNVMLWQAGQEGPASRKNYGFLIWKKRNCVVF